MLSQFCTLGVDYIKVGSRAFFMDIVLSNYAKYVLAPKTFSKEIAEAFLNFEKCIVTAISQVL